MLSGLYNSLWEFAEYMNSSGLRRRRHSGVLPVLPHENTESRNSEKFFRDIYIPSVCFLPRLCAFSYRFIRRETSAVRRITQENDAYWSRRCRRAGYTRIFQNSDHSSNRVVCIIDDDRSKQDRRMFGVPIVGGRDKIVKAAEKYGVEEIIIAIPSISHESKKRDRRDMLAYKLQDQAASRALSDRKRRGQHKADPRRRY